MGDDFTIVVGIFIAGTAVVEESRTTEYAIAVLNTVIGSIRVANTTGIKAIGSIADTGTVKRSGAVWVAIIIGVHIRTDALCNAVTIIDEDVVNAIEENMAFIVATIAVCNTGRQASRPANTGTAVVGECTATWKPVAVNDARLKASGSADAHIAGVPKRATPGEAGTIRFTRLKPRRTANAVATVVKVGIRPVAAVVAR